MKRLNKEYKINNSNNFKTKIGTVNKDNPQIIYLINEGWIVPNGDKRKFKLDLESVEEDFRNELKVLTKENCMFDKKFICNFDVKSNRMKIDKASALSVEVYLKQLDNNVKLLPDIKDYLINISSKITNELNEKLKELGYTIKKQR